MASPMIALKAPLMDKKDYSANFPLKHAQKDMRFALGLGDKVSHPVDEVRSVGGGGQKQCCTRFYLGVPSILKPLLEDNYE